MSTAPLPFIYETANKVRVELGEAITVQGREIRVYQGETLLFHEVTTVSEKIADLITQQVEAAFVAGEAQGEAQVSA